MEIKNTFNKFQDKYFTLSEQNKFKFNTLDYKVDGMIFISSTLIVPLLTFIFATLFFYLSDPDNGIYSRATFQLVNIISISIGFVCLYQRNPKMFWKYGYGWFYLFIYIPILIVLFSSLILGIFMSNNNQSSLSIIVLIAQIIAEVIIVFLVFKFDNNILNILKETFKKQSIQLLIVGVIGLILLFTVSNLFFGGLIEKKLLGVKESDNQSSLIGPINDDTLSKGIKVFYIIMLFILTVILAPICEEVAIRHSFFLNCSNKWLGFVASSVFFGFMHFGAYGDFGHFLSYVSAGFIITGIFLISKGNLTYSWLTHVLNNFVSFIIMIVGVSL